MAVKGGCLVTLYTKNIIEDIASHTRISYTHRKSQKVEELIYSSIEEIVKEIGKGQPLLKVSEIIKVGSHNEGTKINQPDEFDYLAVLDELSKPGVVIVETKDGETQSGLAKVRVVDEYNVDGKWDKFCSKGYVRCMHSTSMAEDYKYQTFGREVIQAIRRLYLKDRKSFTQLMQIDCFDRPPEYSQDVMDLQQAMLSRAEAKSPNVVITYIIANTTIDVDLSPAIRYHNVQHCFSAEDCFSPILAESVLNRETILLVGQEDCDVRITFTETEVDFIRNMMKEKHKTLYIYMKYLANAFGKVFMITSYALKTACIRHDLECQRQDGDLSLCFEEVLDILSRAYEKYTLPSVFNIKVNLLKKADLITINYGQLVIQCWQRICQLTATSTTFSTHKADIEAIAKEAHDSFFYPFHTSIDMGIWSTISSRKITLWLPVGCPAYKSFLKSIMKTRLFKCIENFTCKNWNFSDKKLWYFFIFLPKT